MNNKLKIPIVDSLSVSFDLPLHPRQIKQWRGAFIELAQFRDDLFHNHKGDTEYHYRYPLIQYRIQNKKAAILAIGDGVVALQQVLSEHEWQIRWKGRTRRLKVEDFQMYEHVLRMSSQPQTYRLCKYLPFKKEHYEKWKASTNYIERINHLERILTGHLLGFATAMNWQIPEYLKVDIQYIQSMQKIRHHDTDLLAFDLSYSCNLLLPKMIGLGRSISHGFGCQKKVLTDAQSYAHRQYTEHPTDHLQRIKQG